MPTIYDALTGVAAQFHRRPVRTADGKILDLELRPLYGEEEVVMKRFGEGVHPPKMWEETGSPGRYANGVTEGPPPLSAQGQVTRRFVGYDYQDPNYVVQATEASDKQQVYIVLKCVKGLEAATPGDTLEEKMQNLRANTSSSFRRQLEKIIEGLQPEVGESVDFFSNKNSGETSDSNDSSRSAKKSSSEERAPKKRSNAKIA